MTPRSMSSWTMRLLFAMTGVSSGLSAQQAGAPNNAGAVVARDSLLVQRERAQWDALKAQDTSTFARLLGGNVVDVDVSGIRATSPATTTRYVRGCQTTSFALSDVHVAHYAATVVVTYKATVEATC